MPGGRVPWIWWEEGLGGVLEVLWWRDGCGVKGTLTSSFCSRLLLIAAMFAVLGGLGAAVVFRCLEIEPEMRAGEVVVRPVPCRREYYGVVDMSPACGRA